MNSKKRTIILITGVGHSGSTILDKYLGSLNEHFFSLGELIHIQKTIQINNFCTCHKKIKECNFWQKVDDRLNGRLFQAKKESNFSSYSKSSLLFELYEAIFDVSKANVLVDSSKNLKRALFINKELGGHYDIINIHLIRNPRGVCASYRKGQWKLPIEIEGHSKSGHSKKSSIPMILMYWIVKNIKIFLLFKIRKIKNVIYVKFDQFASNPKSYIDELMNFFPYNNINYPVFIGRQDSHIVNGNASRFYKGYLKPPGEFKTQNLSKIQMLMIDSITLPFRWFFRIRN